MMVNLEEIRDNKTLRPFFINYISRNIAVGLTDIFEVNYVDQARIKSEMYEALSSLVTKLSESVSNEELNYAMEEVCRFYIMEILARDSYQSGSN